MTLLDELATKDDIKALEERFDLKLGALRNGLLAEIRAEMVSQTRTFVVASLGSVVSVGALAFAAARLV